MFDCSAFFKNQDMENIFAVRKLKTMIYVIGAVIAVIMALVFLPFCAYAGEEPYDNTVYLADGGEGDGLSPEAPAGDLVELLRAQTGSTHVILVDNYTLSKDETLTNVTLDTDYPVKISAADGAALQFNASVITQSSLEIDDITLVCHGSNWFKLQCNPFKAGENVRCSLAEDEASFPTIVGSTQTNITNKSTEITIKSGDWDRLRGGSSASPDSVKARTEGGSVFSVNISGGRFHGYVALGTRGNATGAKVRANISGGEFFKGIFIIYNESENLKYGYKADYDADILLSGGCVHGVVAPSNIMHNTLSGIYRVTVTGGDYSCLTDILAPEKYNGTMVSEICVSEDFRNRVIPAKEQVFTNPVMSAADPFLFYKDGYYYLVKTASRNLVLYKATSLAELKTVNGITVFTLTDGQNLWSPEIHCFSEEEVGAQACGWYCFIGYAANETEGETSSSRQRQYVLKCLDEDDDLLGKWGDPVTGLAQPRRITNPDDPDFNADKFCVGTSKIVIKGRPYMIYITEFGRGTSEFHQEIMLCAIENPWTYRGESVSVCKPEYSWEAHGYAYSASADKWYPKVVEGSSPVYYTDENGEEQFYLIYTGSGYWTQYYALGYLRCTDTDDPLNPDNWEKCVTSPILVRDYSKNIINGCGHGSYMKVGDEYWVAYHAYIEKNAGGGRYAFFEPIYVDENGVAIGDKDNHPANFSKEYHVFTSRMTLSEKINGFGTIKEPEETVYLSAAAGNDDNGGITPEAPVKTFDEALRRLSGFETGTVIICGPAFTDAQRQDLPQMNGITVTSVYRGRDFREEADACLNICGDVVMNGDLTFSGLNIATTAGITVYAMKNSFAVIDCKIYVPDGNKDPITSEEDIRQAIIGVVSERGEIITDGISGLDLTEDELFGGDDGLYGKAFKVRSAYLRISDSLAMHFCVDISSVASGILTGPDIEIIFGGRMRKVTDTEINGNLITFDVCGIGPECMADEITVKLSSVYENRKVEHTFRYSAAQYLYDLLKAFSPEKDNSEYAKKVRTLAVDLLNYGAASQVYMSRNTGRLANEGLTEDERLWGTNLDPECSTVKNTAYETVSKPSAYWRSASLSLGDKVSFLLKFDCEYSASELMLLVRRGDGSSFAVSGSEFEKTGRRYQATVSGVLLQELRDSYYFTVLKGNMPVSNTLCYSAESYAFAKQNSQPEELADLLRALMKCCDSAAEYIAAKS